MAAATVLRTTISPPPTDPPMTTRGRGVDLRRLPRRFLVYAALLPFVVAGAIGLALAVRGASGTPTTIGSVAPDFSLVDLDGDPVRLADLRGHPVIVNFWASWCGPCVDEFPLLRAVADEHTDDGLEIVGIVYQDRVESARAFMANNGGTWPAVMDPDSRVAEAYNIFAPPETYFIGRDGRIVARHIGQFTAESLEDKVAAIMDEE
jgi:cytochrome c biogenesis protein CcmG/thiol:disulfide interchange protein DsbE